MRNTLGDVMPPSVSWLDQRFQRYAWYRKWQAKRSRSRLAKEAVVDTPKGVEVYKSTVAEREAARHAKLVKLRNEKSEAMVKEEAFLEACMILAKAEAVLNPDRTEEIYQALKKNRDTLGQRFRDATEEKLRQIAFERHTWEIFDVKRNERDPKEG